MGAPSPTWETIYRHDRRAHRHRCRRCNRIIADGAPVLMARVIGRKTYAVHLECAAEPHPCGTWRDAMFEWGRTYLRASGLSDAAISKAESR